MRRLEGKIAVVTGASRGAGRGIARVLGEEGATVYVWSQHAGSDMPSPAEPNETFAWPERVARRTGDDAGEDELQA